MSFFNRSALALSAFIRYQFRKLTLMFEFKYA